MPAYDEDADLAAAQAWLPEPWPRITPEDRAELNDRFDALVLEREQRRDAHRDRLTRTARRLGREVAAHRVTVAEAQRQLEALVLTYDNDAVVPIFLVQYDESVAIVEAAFAEGARSRKVA